MGLASAQITFLALTARKADCELSIGIMANRKSALAREASDLSAEYYRKLQSKNLTFFANNQYNTINYEYLMGNGMANAIADRTIPLKESNSTVLTDYRGLTVLSDTYAKVLTALGCPAENGRGGTFSCDNAKMAKILYELCGTDEYTEERFKALLDNEDIGMDINMSMENSLTGESTVDKVFKDEGDQLKARMQSMIDFYRPIFQAAATNGWTTEYNVAMSENENYISDAIMSGTLCLAQVTDTGNYEEDLSLTYFITAGLCEQRTDSSYREAITAWYDAEKETINEKEVQIDMTITDLSTELEAIKTEMDSIASFIDDAVGSVFDWGAS